MKKIILVILVINIFHSSYGQEFLGIKVDGKSQDVVNAFKAKGFVSKTQTNPNVVTLNGTVSGKSFEVLVVSTPKSKTVWKISVYLPQKTSWYSLKSEYEEYLKILTDKYGIPENSYTFFSSPYSEGDGYEMTGVSSEKCNYAAFWSEERGISIEISKYKQVNISYQNNTNTILNRKEKAEVDKDIF